MSGTGSAAKHKGDRAEREAALILCSISGHECRRKLGAGRQDDEGDIEGIPNTSIQVAHWKNIAAAVREKPLGAEQQRINAGNEFCFTMIKIRGDWRVVMTPLQFERYLRRAA